MTVLGRAPISTCSSVLCYFRVEKSKTHCVQIIGSRLHSPRQQHCYIQHLRPIMITSKSNKKVRWSLERVTCAPTWCWYWHLYDMLGVTYSLPCRWVGVADKTAALRWSKSIYTPQPTISTFLYWSINSQLYHKAVNILSQASWSKGHLRQQGSARGHCMSCPEHTYGTTLHSKCFSIKHKHTDTMFNSCLSLRTLVHFIYNITAPWIRCDTEDNDCWFWELNHSTPALRNSPA